MKTKSLAKSLAIAGLAPMLLILVSCGGKADDAGDPEFKEITAYARELANSGENCLKVFAKPNAAASVLGSLIMGRCVVALGEEKALAEAIVYTEYEGIQNGLTPDQAANAAYVLMLQNRRDQLRDVLARSKERNTTPTSSPGAAGTYRGAGDPYAKRSYGPGGRALKSGTYGPGPKTTPIAVARTLPHFGEVFLCLQVHEM
jgi:hypothetical protein